LAERKNGALNCVWNWCLDRVQYMLCCLSVCVGVLATVSGQQMVHYSCVTSHRYFIISDIKQ